VSRPSIKSGEAGFLMAALIVAMGVMMIMMAAALPAWQTLARREREAELVFRGTQYARAIGGFQRKYGGAFPPTVDVLVEERFLRKKFKDPITEEDFVIVSPGSALPTTSTIPGIGNALTGGRSGASTSSPSATSSLGGRSSIQSSSSLSTASGRGTTTATQAGRGSTPSAGGGGITGATGLQAGATPGVMGVRSKSTEKSFRLYNGLEHYNEWIFVGTQASSQAGGPGGAQTPGAGTRGGAAGSRGGQPAGSRGGQPAGGRGIAPPGNASPFTPRGAGPGSAR
jgi:type II secretory pathway pseudopilin PulG